MRLYNRYYKSNYHELISHYPRYYREVFEMVEILKAQGKVVDALEDNIEQTFLDHFILTADPPTIRTWEKFLDITYEEQLTLEQRRRVVIARLCGLGHIGEPEIRAIIGNYSEGETDVDFENSSIMITINGEIFDRNNLIETLLRRIPAHLGLFLHNIITAPEATGAMYIAPALGRGINITELPEIEPITPEKVLYITPYIGQCMNVTNLPGIEPEFRAAPVMLSVGGTHSSVTTTSLPPLPEFETVIPAVAHERASAVFTSYTETTLPEIKEESV